MMDKIIIYPDFGKLKAEVEELRTEITMLVLERDHLLYQECKNIETAYMLSIGVLEYKAYEIECVILRLKRKVELIQAKKNRQEKIILSEIEAILDAEFAEYAERLSEQIDRMNEALERSKGRLLTEQESRELKALYRAIVKALHPDLHPGIGREKLRLFHNAVDAYGHGDLDGLRMISAMLAEPLTQGEESLGLAFLMKEKARLIKLLESIESRIQEIKSEYPYTMKVFMESPEKTEARKSELEEQIKSLTETRAVYTQRIEEMLR